MAETKCACPHCNQRVSIDSAYAGHAVACPNCGNEFTVPHAEVEPAATAAAPQLVVPPSPQAGQAENYAAAAAQYAAPPSNYGTAAPAPYIPRSGGGGIGAVFSDPLEGQPGVIAALGPGGTARWGWIFASVWVLVSWLFSWRMGTVLFSSLPGVGSSGRGRRRDEVELLDHIEWIASGVIPVLAMVLVLLLLKTMAGKQVPFGSILFTSGVVALPLIAMALFIMLLSFLEIKSSGAAKVLGHITIIFSIAVFTSVILLIKASLVSVIGYTRKAAFWLVPAVVLAVGYLTDWLGALVGEISK